MKDPLLTAEDVAERLNVTKDWVWDHCRIENFINERERLTHLRRKRG